MDSADSSLNPTPFAPQDSADCAKQKPRTLGEHRYDQPRAPYRPPAAPCVTFHQAAVSLRGPRQGCCAAVVLLLMSFPRSRSPVVGVQQL